ncbi:MAG: PAS domain S-box protein [Candidatus Tectomicrobia bacterium]|uniref:PAS domain S-box protein n=1 Tax=Tectimicrobiota bacterium TaxID=2528274 RepID=A0A937W024_UNCTE|nr:PAS domain S-box protein [Candidatus Tectomicrobia bacterium]
MKDEVLAVLAQTADGVYALDQTQRIVFWNAAAERLLGYRAEEVLGQPCHTLFAGEPRPGCLECQATCPVMTAAQHHEVVPTYNLLSRTKNGDAILLNVSVIVPPQHDESLMTIHLFRDATHQLRYETYVEHILCAAARLPAPAVTLARTHSEGTIFYAPLSAREKEVLLLLVHGKAARDIADTLCISYATVRNHLHTILRKLGVHSQRQAIKIAIEHRLV